MERRILICFAIILLMVYTLPVNSRDVTKVGTTAAPFLTISTGARAMGMGGAFVSVANDASAMFWNVAGIAQLPKNEIIFNHSNWLADISYEYAGITMPLSAIGTLGVSFTFLNMGEFEQTTEYQPEGTGLNFDASSFAIGLSYARQLTDNFMIGFTGKYIRENIFNSTAQGFAMDVGALFVTPFNGMRLGLAITNFGTKMQMSGDDMLVQVDIDPTIDGNNPNINSNIQTDEFDLPLLFRFGLSMDVIETEMNRLTVAVDALHPNDNAESVNVGGEYTYNNLISFRAGYRALFLADSEEGFTVGGGLLFDISGVGLQLDYAYEDFNRLGDIQKFTIFLKL